MPNNRLQGYSKQPRRLKPYVKQGKVLDRLEYGLFIGLFSIVYGIFIYYSIKYLDIIYDDIIHFTLSFPTKVAGGLGIACVIVWFLVLAATIWRGRDIGFPKWFSILMYLIPFMPRFFAMFFGVVELDSIAETLSSVLWLIVAGFFLYLPTDWYTKKKFARPSKIPKD